MAFPDQAMAVDIGSVWPLATVMPNTLGGMVSYLLPKALLFGSLVFFVLVIIAGFGLMSGSGGDPHAQEQAKNFLTYAVLGLVIMFGAFWILQLLNFVTGGSLNSLLGP